MSLKEKIDEWCDENYPGESILLATGFDEAFMGVGVQFNTPIALYDRTKCIEILMEDGMTPEEAEEYFQFNVQGAYVGEDTPAFVERFNNETID